MLPEDVRASLVNPLGIHVGFSHLLACVTGITNFDVELSVRTHGIDLCEGEGLGDRPGSTISVPALRKDNGVEEFVAGRVCKRGLSLTSLRGGSPSGDCGDFLFLPGMALSLQVPAKIM